MDPNLRRLAVGAAIRTLGAAIYNPFLALFLVNVLHLPYLEVGLIIAGVGLILLPFNLLGGLLADRIGRLPLLLLGIFGEAAATAGLAYSFWIQSLTGSIVAALTGGVLTTIAGPASSAYIADHALGSERTRGYTFFRVGFNAGFSIGVTIGGLLIASLGFAGAVAVATAVILGGAIYLAATLDPSPMDRELRTGRGLPGAPLARRSGPTMRESFSKLARDGPALEVLLGFGFAGLVVGQWAVTFPLFVHNVLGISYALLGIGLALNGLVVVFGQTLTTEGVIGRRHTSIAIVGTGLYVVAFLGLGLSGLFLLAPAFVFLVSVVVLTVGENLLSIPQSTLPSNLAPTGEVGSYNGAFNTIGGAGFIASVVLGGAVLGATSDPFLIWLYLTVPAVPAVLLIRHAAGRLPRSKDTA